MIHIKKKKLMLGFAIGPEVKTPCFHCRGHKFDPWLRNSNPASYNGMAKKKADVNICSKLHKSFKCRTPCV